LGYVITTCEWPVQYLLSTSTGQATHTPHGLRVQTVAYNSKSRWVFTARLRPQFRMPPVRGSVVRIRQMMRKHHFWICTSSTATASTLLHAGAALRFQRAHTIRSAGGCRNGKLQNVSPPSVLFESSRIFLQHTGETDAKR